MCSLGHLHVHVHVSTKDVVLNDEYMYVQVHDQWKILITNLRTAQIHPKLKTERVVMYLAILYP